MTEKELINQLKELRAIKPREDWVVLTKHQILPEEEIRPATLIFHWKLAFAPVISVFIIIGLFGFARNTVPGDWLFSVKKITETVQIGLSSTAEKPEVHLKLANRRLEELNKIAETNQVRNLGPTIKEFQDNVAEATRGLAEIDILALKELVQETKKLEENKQKVESVLGVQVGGDTEQLEKQIASYLLADLERRTLNDEDQALFAQAKEYFESGDYTLALEKLLLLSNQ